MACHNQLHLRGQTIFSRLSPPFESLDSDSIKSQLSCPVIISIPGTRTWKLSDTKFFMIDVCQVAKIIWTISGRVS